VPGRSELSMSYGILRRRKIPTFSRLAPVQDFEFIPTCAGARFRAFPDLRRRKTLCGNPNLSIARIRAVANAAALATLSREAAAASPPRTSAVRANGVPTTTRRAGCFGTFYDTEKSVAMRPESKSSLIFPRTGRGPHGSLCGVPIPAGRQLRWGYVIRRNGRRPLTALLTSTACYTTTRCTAFAVRASSSATASCSSGRTT
jgi:hypothetical protein